MLHKNAWHKSHRGHKGNSFCRNDLSFWDTQVMNPIQLNNWKSSMSECPRQPLNKHVNSNMLGGWLRPPPTPSPKVFGHPWLAAGRAKIAWWHHTPDFAIAHPWKLEDHLPFLGLGVATFATKSFERLRICCKFPNFAVLKHVSQLFLRHIKGRSQKIERSTITSDDKTCGGGHDVIRRLAMFLLGCGKLFLGDPKKKLKMLQNVELDNGPAPLKGFQ